MLRWKVGPACVIAAVAVGVGWVSAPAVLGGGRVVLATAERSRPEAARVLQVYYTAPVLVRAGERVLLPVDVVCATASGDPCAASVTLAVRAGSQGVVRATVPATKSLAFDLSAPAARAASTASGSVAFWLSAAGPRGRTVALPPGHGPGSLRFYVTSRMPVVRVPRVPFGRVRVGTTVLALPWGSGPRRVGLQLGNESPTLGPSGFDVGAAGRVFVVDALLDRVAVFSAQRLLGQAPLDLTPRAGVTAAANGEAAVVDSMHGMVTVHRVGERGAVGKPICIGPGEGAQIRSVDGGTFAYVLPLDAWLRVPEPGRRQGGAFVGGLTVGMPVPGGRQLLRVASADRIRLGYSSFGSVRGAVELRSAARFGDVPLAEPDGHGGFVVVVHEWRGGPSPADQYQVIHVRGARVLETFAVASASFAQAPPLARFRLGRDGALYQMSSSPEGMRILRFEMRGGR